MERAVYDDPTLLNRANCIKTDVPGGGYVLRSSEALLPHARCIGEWLERWSRETPDALAFAQRDPQGAWEPLTWSQLRAQVGAVAQGLLDLNLPADRPVVVLSDNSLDHLILNLATMHIGRAACTVSSAYSRLAQGDYGRLHPILQTLNPALIYAADAKTYAPGASSAGTQAKLCFSEGASSVPGALAFASLQASAETPAVMAAYASITPDTHAKYLLTSGSTGTPKVVINTHGMLCANQQQLAQTLRFLTVEKPILLDWLPWSHTFGGNHNTHIVMAHGGTLYIDDGRPVPGLIDKTIANLREVQPTAYFNVPRGYDMLLPHLEADPVLARNLFGRLKMLFYAGAGMPQSTWARLEAAASKVRDLPLWMTTSWGATETSPAITFPSWRLERAGVIGLPLPGIDLKFVPNGGKLEMRVRGPNVFPGYRDNPEATRQAFDDEGYYLIGDAGYLLDPADPQQGVVFDGRVAEDFKLTTGTWVSVGTLRLKVVSALAPWVQDAVITGHDQSELGCMVFLTEPAKALAPSDLISHLQAGLRALKAEGGGSSQVPLRLCILPDVPQASAGEITDKGYLNQRAVLARRSEMVKIIHGQADHPSLIRLT